MSSGEVLRELDDGGLLACLQAAPRPPLEARVEVYEEVTRRYEPGVLKLLTFLLDGDTDAAMDVGQDTFRDVVKSLEKATRFPDPEGLQRWLNKFASNRAKKYLAKKATRRKRQTEWPQDLADDREEMLHGLVSRDPSKLPHDDPVRRAEVFRILGEVTALLPAQDQRIMQLRLEEGIGSAEVAVRLGLPAGTAANKCTNVQSTVRDLFCTWLLVHGDRTRCPALAKILERHEQRHGKGLSADLATAVRTHYAVCKGCKADQEAPKCQHGAPVTECRKCPMCPHGNNCRSCDIARKRLLRDYAPVLIPIVFAAEFHERVRQVIREAAYTTPVGSPSEPPSVSNRPPSLSGGRRRPLRRRLAVPAATLVLAVVIATVVAVLRPGPSPLALQSVAASMPTIAYATDAAVETRSGSDSGHVLAKIAPGFEASSLAWSADGKHLAWVLYPTSGTGAHRVNEADLTSGAVHTWSCASCRVVAFQGNQVESLDGSINETTLEAYPFDGSAPRSVALKGIPAAPSTDPATPATFTLTLLGSSDQDADVLLYYGTSPLDGANVTRYGVYRVDRGGIATPVYVDTNSDTVNSYSGGSVAQSPDQQVMALHDFAEGGDVCQPSDAVTVVNLSTMDHRTVPFPASEHSPWRVTGVWVTADHSVYAAAYPTPASSCGPGVLSGTVTPQVFRLVGTEWKPTGTAAEGGAAGSGSWVALQNSAVLRLAPGVSQHSTPHLEAVSGKTTVPLPGAVIYAWSPVKLGAPMLGHLRANGNQLGYGSARPTTVYNGGDPTGLVAKITWQSWGGPVATGTGTSDYDGQGRVSVAAGTQETVRIVAFDLGTCPGEHTITYRRVSWYYPQHAQTFDAQDAMDACTGYHL